jgi:hypothetical protein
MHKDWRALGAGAGKIARMGVVQRLLLLGGGGGGLNAVFIKSLYENHW